MVKAALVMALAVALAACSDKVPESKAAKDVGNIPKQAVDKAASGVADAMQKGADRNSEQDGEKKQ